MLTTIIKTARPVMFATLVAASGIGLAPFIVDASALAQQGGGGRGGDGGTGGGPGGGSAANTDVYAVIHQDARRSGACIAAPCSTLPQPPTERYTRTRDVPVIGCGAGQAVRLVYDINGDPLRYSCMPIR